ncbi:MAG TPA: Lsr2 family protein [Streptosporangiaceae bacterium]|nr:Lsr2 family protein [Streptosporangiaceae bacterium]
MSILEVVVAQRMLVIFEDDLDGSEAEGTVTFALNGIDYELDLSEKNREKLLKAFEPYVSGGRKVSTRTSSRSSRGGGSPKKHDQSAVREWARGEGMQISGRGRIPADILAKYEAAH